MRDARAKSSKVTFLIMLGVIFFSALIGVGQQSENAGKQAPLIIQFPKNREKPKVIAIRRVNLLLRDPGSKGITDEDRKPYVEIELYVGYPDFNTNLMHLIQVGDREFVVNSWKPIDENYNAVVRMPAQEFEELADAAEIVIRLGTLASREELEKMHEDRRVARIPGMKVDILDKKMIDLEPTVEKRAGWKPPQ